MSKVHSASDMRRLSQRCSEELDDAQFNKVMTFIEQQAQIGKQSAIWYSDTHYDKIGSLRPEVLVRLQNLGYAVIVCNLIHFSHGIKHTVDWSTG